MLEVSQFIYWQEAQQLGIIFWKDELKPPISTQVLKKLVNLVGEIDRAVIWPETAAMQSGS